MKITASFHLRCLLISAVFGAGCGDSADPSSAVSPAENTQHTGSGPIHVVCTTNIIKDLVRQIGGERVAVTAIMDGPGIDPHSYTPSPQDTNALTAADLVVYSGLHLEGQFDGPLESLNHRGIPVICVTEGLASEQPGRLLQTPDGIADPHVWFDPELWLSCGQHLADELSEYDPDGREQYSKSAVAFAELMRTTQAEGRKIIASVPVTRRVLVTAHDAFEYFARAFEFRVEAVQGISTESKPGLRRVDELVTLLVDNRIAAVFTEQSVSDRNIAALVAGCEARQHALKIGGRLYSDTAGAEGTEQETLAGALLHNIRQIADALAETEPDADKPAPGSNAAAPQTGASTESEDSQ
ncbi:MAG: zinc ABC transporter substrate-binding protein [Fuerstiella sp.]|nr:zinc ABC transporter substrate-binding protein [Fuerstiella sp.]